MDCKLTRIKKEDFFWTHGKAVNFLGVGDTIKHPPKDVSPNVAFVDIAVPKTFFPQTYLRYIPNANLDKNEQVTVMGIVTLKDLYDDEELFVDYWDVFLFNKEQIPDWLVVPPPALNHFYVKKDYERKIPLLLEVGKQSFLPEAVLSRHDLQQMLDTKIEQLLLPSMRKDSETKLIEERASQEQPANRLTDQKKDPTSN
jgi:hypothetical protein